ncbi:hypothetical protein CRM22_009391 [Opisthorchis felineus]|uniref:Uncharacterized protein n=1 Tax=Opisthorchis felineus TaxID=147828 RepID=A0A4S2L7L0_OPIFE|nr:hypothetical protein CRM22_009391 [Opisthorchis felineus]
MSRSRILGIHLLGICIFVMKVHGNHADEVDVYAKCSKQCDFLMSFMPSSDDKFTCAFTCVEAFKANCDGACKENYQELGGCTRSARRICLRFAGADNEDRTNQCKQGFPDED